MNLPFSVPRPNMDRFNFLSRNREDSNRQNTVQNQAHDDYDDATPLSPSMVVPDLEAQRGGPEMIERPAPRASLLPRFRGPIPSWFSVTSSRRGRHHNQPRPASSHYSGDGLPPDTVVDDRGGIESPKTPVFRIGAQNLPSTRLHLPNLARTWTQGSNGPPSRPGTGRPRSPETGSDDEIAMPAPAVTAAGRGVNADEETGTGRHRRHRHGGSGGSGSHSSHRSHRHHQSHRSRDETGSRPGTSGSRSDGNSRRSRRRRDRDRQCERGRLDEQEQQTTERRRRHRRKERSERQRGPPPKHFLFCFPWIKSRRMRQHILRCFVSGILLALLLSIYLALSITKNINNSEFTVLLILIILFITIFFCHGLIRICMMVFKGGRNPDDEGSTSSSSSQETTQLPHTHGPGGYAMPREPIRVVMARDEEAAGIESETTKMQPPAYGIWRESVRVDPNRIYWMRNTQEPSPAARGGPSTTAGGAEEEWSSSSSSLTTTTSAPSSSVSSVSDGDYNNHRGATTPRPPSYISEDGVNYVVEAQPRSIAPTTDVPLASNTSVHPAEMGRAGRPAGW